jgi:hypothetical protein
LDNDPLSFEPDRKKCPVESLAYEMCAREISVTSTMRILKNLNKYDEPAQKYISNRLDYINEQFPLSKENKVMYYRILMKRPQFLHAHIEWLYNNPNVFLGDMFTRMKLWGLNEYMNTYYRSLSPEMFQNQYEMYERIIKFNDEQDYEYAKTKYRTDIGLCRSNSGNTPLTERIRLSGLYAYLETYGGLTTGIKLQKYYTMMTNCT